MIIIIGMPGLGLRGAPAPGRARRGVLRHGLRVYIYIYIVCTVYIYIYICM